MKSKYKIVGVKTDMPLRIEIKSDSNVIEFVALNGDVFTYKYIKSETKLGRQVTMNKKQLLELIKINT